MTPFRVLVPVALLFLSACKPDPDPDRVCFEGEFRTCYSGTNATQGIGACVGGTQTCVDNAWGSCDGEVFPAVELCDGIDNDCDGTVDDPFKDGTVAFSGGPNPADADKRLGQGCGTGRCGGGTVVCDADQLGLTCSTLGQASEDVCDGQDNDCNGAADESFTEGGSVVLADAAYAPDNGKAKGQTCGIGACGGGTVVCGADQRSLSCSTAAQASAETCDNADNDCNGSEDEPFLASGTQRYEGAPLASDNGKYKGQACGTGDCAGGTVVCAASGAGLTCSTAANAQPTDGCGSGDDDCDGAVDENFVVGSACSTGEAGRCSAGTASCDGNTVTCNRTEGPTSESCNDVDDNCDGNIDEGVLGTAQCPAFNCAHIAAKWPAANGAYEIKTPSCSSPSRRLFCDMDRGGWTLVMLQSATKCQPIMPDQAYGSRAFLADCNSWDDTTTWLQSHPAYYATHDFSTRDAVSAWVNVTQMPWTEMYVTAYRDHDGIMNTDALREASPAIHRSSFSTAMGGFATTGVVPFGQNGYYVNDGIHVWCGGSKGSTCKGAPMNYSGYDYSDGDQRNRGFTFEANPDDVSCPQSTMSTCIINGTASCWAGDNEYSSRAVHAIWIF